MINNQPHIHYNTHQRHQEHIVIIYKRQYPPIITVLLYRIRIQCVDTAIDIDVTEIEKFC